jgi:P27 family predicted phage terminase small subunit
MGRPPKPTALKVIEGNRGHRPLPANEPKPLEGIPSCPRHLSLAAKGEWRRISRELKHMGLLTRVDRAALACYCMAWARWVEAEGHLATEGAVQEGRQKGLVKSPWVRIAEQAMEKILRFSAEFGLTPSARCRIDLPGTKQRPLHEIAAERAARIRAKLQ